MITQGVSIPKEDGMLLASQKNPWAEASKWAERLCLFPKRTQVVLGLGAGIHILELARKSDFNIIVVEPRAWLFDSFFELITHETNSQQFQNRISLARPFEIFEKLQLANLEMRPYQVHEFRPAWGPRTAEFLKLRDELNGRTIDSAKTMVEVEEHLGPQMISLKNIRSSNPEFQLLKEVIK